MSKEVLISSEGIKQAIDDLVNENEKLKNIINKAIKELEKGITFCINDSKCIPDMCSVVIAREKKILDILKGEE